MGFVRVESRLNFSSSNVDSQMGPAQKDEGREADSRIEEARTVRGQPAGRPVGCPVTGQAHCET
jgi:hypothetical protein